MVIHNYKFLFCALRLHNYNLNINGEVRGEIDTATRVQILDKIVCISQNANTLGKGTNPSLLSVTMGRQGRPRDQETLWPRDQETEFPVEACWLSQTEEGQTEQI